MRFMKIIILSDNFDGGGGAAIIARSMAQGFKHALHDVHVITSVKDRALAGQKMIEGIKLWSVYSDYNFFWRAYRSLYNPQAVNKVAKIIEELIVSQAQEKVVINKKVIKDGWL